MTEPYHYATAARGEFVGLKLKVDPLVGIPPDARPWDLVKAVLPEGWGIVVLGSNEGEGRVRVASLIIGRLTDHGVALSAADTYTVALQSPVTVNERELDDGAPWVDQELARRRAT